MQWEKKRLISVKQVFSGIGWANDSLLQPTPLKLNDEIIRVYVGIRDEFGVGRIGCLDLDAKNPSNIISFSKNPVLDVGLPGTFDDNGVIPSAVIKHEGKVYLYYAGYSILKHVRFAVLGGLAISEDNGMSFKRFKNTPVFERTSDEFLFRVPHSVIVENGTWRFWYGGGSKFVEYNNYTLPVYDIRYTESNNAYDIPDQGRVIITTATEEEYRIARPYVIKKNNNMYQMFNCVATKALGYRLGYAESTDGVKWQRMDTKLGIDVSQAGWDSKMMGYPSIVDTKYGTYLFYNGNDYGKEGFGYAVLKSE